MDSSNIRFEAVESSADPYKERNSATTLRKRELGIGGAIVMAAIAALYVASPYYALWKLKNAVVNKDSLVLERIVDWPRIREQIRSQIVATSMANTSTDKSAFGTLGTALGAAMVGPMIESMVHPATIIRATENNPNFAEKMKELDLRSGYFIGATAFRLDVEGPRKFGDDPTKLGLILEFQGTGWRVTHIDLPWQQLQEATKEPTPSSERSSPATDREIVGKCMKFSRAKELEGGSRNLAYDSCMQFNGDPADAWMEREAWKERKGLKTY